MPKPYQTTASRIAWTCPWYNVRQDDIITPDGSQGVYNVIQAPLAVWIIPVTPAKEVVLIHTYRYTVDDWCYEIPAGSVKPDQSLPDAAKAELLEEIGGTAVSLQHLGQFYPLTGICNQIGHVFLATDVTLGPPQREPTEVMECHPLPIPQALHMAQTNQISDGPSALALLLFADHLRALC